VIQRLRFREVREIHPIYKFEVYTGNYGVGEDGLTVAVGTKNGILLKGLYRN
jgi:hypothetical protein